MTLSKTQMQYNRTASDKNDKAIHYLKNQYKKYIECKKKMSVKKKIKTCDYPVLKIHNIVANAVNSFRHH